MCSGSRSSAGTGSSASSSASAATPRASFSDRGIRRAFGVLVGVFLSQVFTIAHESRARRLDALVGLVAASGRMIGAYERLFELFEGGTSPPLDEDRVVAVTSERLSAHTEWREAQARAEILLADDSDLYAVVSDFETVRSTATAWARAYFQAGERSTSQTTTRTSARHGRG